MLHYHKDLPKLHFTSKKVYKDSRFAWEKSSNGHHLRVDFWPIHNIYPTPNNEDLRSKITKMTFFGYSPRDMHFTNFERTEWDHNETAFPNLNEIHVEWSVTRFKYERWSNKVCTQAWNEKEQPGSITTFLYREGDSYYQNDYHRPVPRLKLWYLFNRVNSGDRQCKIFVTSTLQWLDHKRKPVFFQVSLVGVRFLKF